jgi:hypothetical protein
VVASRLTIFSITAVDPVVRTDRGPAVLLKLGGIAKIG